MTVKESTLVPGPAGVITLTFPEVVPVATVAVSRVSEPTVKAVTGTLLTVTPVAPKKPVPERVMTVPTGPEGGVMLWVVGMA